MKTTTALLLAASTTLLNAQQTKGPTDPQDTGDYLEAICNPSNATGYPDFSAPCNAAVAIYYQCLYGPTYLSNAMSATESDSDGTDDSDDTDSKYPMQSNSTQRTCFCESQFFDQTLGCQACYVKHGLPSAQIIEPRAMTSISSAYCAATATPSAAFPDYFSKYTEPATPTATPTGSSSFSDPIGNKTAVSLYYTPSVSGSAAWLVAEATASASSGLGTFMSTKTANGQIVATATGGSGGSSNGGSGSSGSAAGASGASSTSSTKNSAQTHGAAAAAGLIGVAGLVALL